MWYFDSQIDSIPNVANPRNSEPKFAANPTPNWSDFVSRYLLTTTTKYTLNIGNFLDFDQREIVRGITIVLNLRVNAITLANNFSAGNILFDLQSDYRIRGLLLSTSTQILLSITYPVNITNSGQGDTIYLPLNEDVELVLGFVFSET